MIKDPFDETVCDALITNRDVKKMSKRCKMFATAEPSNTVQILVACAMQGTRLVHSNCLRWGRTTETGSHINVCAIYGIQFALMNCLLLGSATETVRHIKVCVIYGIRFTRTNYFRLGNTTEMVQLNKMCKWYAAYSSHGWTVRDEPKEHKRVV